MTIGIDQSSFTRSSFKHRCMNNIKKIYQHAGEFDDQQNIKVIIETAILSTPEEFTCNSPDVPMKSSPVKKPSDRKSLCLFTNIFDVKKKIAKRRIGAAKSKIRAVKVGNILWTKKRKEKEMRRSNVICMHG